MAVHADERTPLLPASGRSAASEPEAETRENGTTATTTPDAASLARIASKGTGDDNDTADQKKSWLQSLWSPANRVLLAGFIISLSFSFTQVSIFYVFRLMECDVYYSNHPPYTGNGDRCSRDEVAAGTAVQFAILGMSTTFCGTWNLFVSGHQVKRWGPRAALVLQTFIPAIRVATQIIGVVTGGRTGIWIIQVTQVITILGGPAGYILVVNTIAGEVVPPLQRTALFGQLQGCLMAGMAIGYLSGGIVGETFGIIRPFQTAFFLFCLASLYARFAMPYISPESLSGPNKAARKKGGLAGFFEPLKVLLPQKIRLHSGRIVNHYGVFFLCCGVFLGVLATGYAPILLQMYATAKFDFNQADNGWLMSGNGGMRAIFLIFIFPRIISVGRRWFGRLYRLDREQKQQQRRRQPATPAKPSRQNSSDAVTDAATVAASSDDDGNSRGDNDADIDGSTVHGHSPTETEAAEQQVVSGEIPTDPELFDAPTNTQAEEEPLLPNEPSADQKDDEEKAAYAFDLFFLRWSLLVDGVITAGAALATDGWHMYLLTVLLPFGSGSAPAAKGVITSMCPSSQRTDALNAITLVENMSRLATLGLFGFIFSALAEIGQAHLTFYCNGALAVVAMLVLMLSHFPPSDSALVEEGEEAEASSSPSRPAGAQNGTA